MNARRDEMVAALARTAKPYFGDVEEMTYLAWATRYAELCVAPHSGRAATVADWADEGWYDRFIDLLHRIEARLSQADHGEIPTLFADYDAVIDSDAALAALAERYPSAVSTLVEPVDAAWFVDLCRKHPKPVPFVPVVDADILRWWGTDSLWQSQDPRYTADQVRIIPGPVAVAGITTINEPVGELLGRFETAAVEALREAGTGEQEAADQEAHEREHAGRRSVRADLLNLGADGVGGLAISLLRLAGGEAAISFDNPRYLLVAACQPFIALFCLYRLFGWYRLAKRGQLAAHGDGSDTALTGTNQHESF